MPDVLQTPSLIQDWLAAPDEAAQRRAAAAPGRVVLDGAGTLLLGIFTIRTAFRSSIDGILDGNAPYPWDVHRV